MTFQSRQRTARFASPPSTSQSLAISSFFDYCKEPLWEAAEKLSANALKQVLDSMTSTPYGRMSEMQSLDRFQFL